MGSALGVKFGLWSWQLGLLTLVGMGGLALIAVTAILALASIILIVRKPVKAGLIPALFALVVALGIGGVFFAPVLLNAGNHPIHDMATDTTNPPQFSETVLAARAAAGANLLNGYDVALSDTKQFGATEGGLAKKTYADIIASNYPELAPLPIGDTGTNQAVEALQMAMADMGMTDIRYNEETATVEGLAETFWFGFKDDVVARVEGGRIDFRSVSRVGQSDLGANAKRIMDLRARTAEKLGL
jgi:uncharacterized protein (DUF1499 family)